MYFVHALHSLSDPMHISKSLKWVAVRKFLQARLSSVIYLNPTSSGYVRCGMRIVGCPGSLDTRLPAIKLGA